MTLSIATTDRLARQHEAITDILADLDGQRIRWQPLPGKWSIHDNVAHLAKYQPLFKERIETILTTDNPVFESYNANHDLYFEEWRRWELTTLLERLRTDREELYDFINTLSESQLQRQGKHSKYGNLSIGQWVEFFLLHEAHHIFTIFQLAHTGDFPDSATSK